MDDNAQLQPVLFFSASISTLLYYWKDLSYWICTTDTPCVHWREQGGCWWGTAGMPKLLFWPGRWCIAVVRQEQVEESSNVSTDTERESSRSSNENCQATRCCSCWLHHICQRAAASPITLTSCSWTLTPLQNFGNKTQTSTGRRWGREKWSSGSLLCSVLCFSLTWKLVYFW